MENILIQTLELTVNGRDRKCPVYIPSMLNAAHPAPLLLVFPGTISFGGCAVVVSHDRWFLDRIATHILAFEGDSKVTWFEGNYEAYHEQRRRLLGDEADKPHRIKFRPVSHK